jgi:hypothetical protein
MAEGVAAEAAAAVVPGAVAAAALLNDLSNSTSSRKQKRKRKHMATSPAKRDDLAEPHSPTPRKRYRKKDMNVDKLPPERFRCGRPFLRAPANDKAARCDWCRGAWGVTKKRSWICTGCGARLCRNTYCCELYHTQKDKWDDKLHAAHNAKQGKMM